MGTPARSVHRHLGGGVSQGAEEGETSGAGRTSWCLARLPVEVVSLAAAAAITVHGNHTRGDWAVGTTWVGYPGGASCGLIRTMRRSCVR